MDVMLMLLIQKEKRNGKKDETKQGIYLQRKRE